MIVPLKASDEGRYVVGDDAAGITYWPGGSRGRDYGTLPKDGARIFLSVVAASGFLSNAGEITKNYLGTSRPADVAASTSIPLAVGEYTLLRRGGLWELHKGYWQ